MHGFVDNESRHANYLPDQYNDDTHSAPFNYLGICSYPINEELV